MPCSSEREALFTSSPMGKFMMGAVSTPLPWEGMGEGSVGSLGSLGPITSTTTGSGLYTSTCSSDMASATMGMVSRYMRLAR